MIFNAERWNSADGKKRSFLTVRWNDLLGAALLSTTNNTVRLAKRVADELGVVDEGLDIWLSVKA
ncbi:MAG: hypothetical protein NNA19_09010, partial [Nitrospira sp.]|nr:hypothetical protein [Nitrospira sp.]